MPLQPVRKIPLSSRSITGKRPSRKTNIIHQFESTLERDLLTLLEFDDEVENYLVQPLIIKYLHQGKFRRYTPDMLVYYKAILNKNPLLVEIKYGEELERKKEVLAPKFDAPKKYASEKGYDFKVITEKDIGTVYLQNIKFLSRYQSTIIEDFYVQRIIKAIS